MMRSLCHVMPMSYFSSFILWTYVDVNIGVGWRLEWTGFYVNREWCFVASGTGTGTVSVESRGSGDWRLEAFEGSWRREEARVWE